MIDKEDKTKNKDSKDRKPDEIIELLTNFYEPEDLEIEEFDLFFDSIEQKLEDQNPVNRISKISDQIETNINLREQKLAQLLRRLDQKKNTSQVKKSKKLKLKPIIAIVVILLLITLASIARINNTQNYNYISLEGENLDWQSLNLNETQKTQLEAIDNEWLAFKSSEETLIESRRTKLVTEMNASSPDFLQIDKYQREILDHEVMLKRQKLNTFLEKRFILNEEQSLQLIREIGKQAK
ncbi:MAG: hypothetical protein O3C63_00270 [Cyanobacteria bacterium]|nr:hypothetical protein [Cyanobacteriota bacterium]MDA1020555.1 hypothetical protein [Cyanobacteriota bacterium]